MSCHESFASRDSASSISASPSSKPSCVISSIHSYIFQYTIKKFDVEIGTIMFNNALIFITYESRKMADIILKFKKFLREYKITLR